MQLPSKKSFMATLGTRKRAALNSECIVCREVPSNPQHLPCRHAHCRGCLVSVVRSGNRPVPTMSEKTLRQNQDSLRSQRNTRPQTQWVYCCRPPRANTSMAYDELVAFSARAEAVGVCVGLGRAYRRLIWSLPSARLPPRSCQMRLGIPRRSWSLYHHDNGPGAIDPCSARAAIGDIVRSGSFHLSCRRTHSESRAAFYLRFAGGESDSLVMRSIEGTTTCVQRI